MSGRGRRPPSPYYAESPRGGRYNDDVDYTYVPDDHRRGRGRDRNRDSNANDYFTNTNTHTQPRRRQDRDRHYDSSSSSVSPSPERRRHPPITTKQRPGAPRRTGSGFSQVLQRARTGDFTGALSGAISAASSLRSKSAQPRGGQQQHRDTRHRGTGGASSPESYYADDYIRDRDRDRGRTSTRRTGSRAAATSRPRTDTERIQRAAKAALTAGAMEAIRVRSQKGPWAGAKGFRVATAAIGAAAIDAGVDRREGGHKRHFAQAAVGGLLANRFANGSRSRSRRR